MKVTKQSINEIVSNNLIHLRKLHGMTKKDVATALGVKPNTYRVWENVNGKNGVKNYYMVQLAKIYGVSVDYLLQSHEEDAVTTENQLHADNTPEKNVYGDNRITELSDAERICLMQLRRLSNADRQKINELIGELLDEMDRFNGITEDDK